MTDSERTITRVSLHDELVGRLRDLIVEGELPPGGKVPEKQLCTDFGVSRTPLREALKVLASEGLLELHPNRGATVAKLTLEDVDEMFPVMGSLEALAGELACRNLTDESLAELRALHYQMVLHYHRSELAPYFRINQEIHEKILDIAGNATLSSLHRGLSGRIRRARYVANMSKARWAQAVEEHERILEALSSRDGPRLGDILRSHLANKAEVIKEGLAADTGEKRRSA